MRNFSFVSDPNASWPRTRTAGRLATFALFLCWAPASPAVAAGATDVPTAAAVAADDQALLEFTQDAPVASSEHDRIAAETRDDVRKYPAQIKHADAVVRDLLAKLPGLKPLEAEAVREELRVRFAMLPDSVLERQILERHDPSIALDRARGQAVTARTIFDIRQASQWLAKQLAIAGPGDDFVTTETAYVRKNFSRFTSDQRDACTHVARNMSTSIRRFESLSPEERKSRLARTRSAIGSSTPLDAVAVLGMARAYAAAHAELANANDTFLATTQAMFHLQNTSSLVMGLEGEIAAQAYAPH